MSKFTRTTPNVSPIELGKTLYGRAFKGADHNSLRPSMQDFEKLSALDQMFILCHLQYLNLQAQAQTQALLLEIRENAEHLAAATIAIADTVTAQPPVDDWSMFESVDAGEGPALSTESSVLSLTERNPRFYAPWAKTQHGFPAGTSQAGTSQEGTSQEGTSEGGGLAVESGEVARTSSTTAAPAAPSELKTPRRRARARAPMMQKEGGSHDS